MKSWLSVSDTAISQNMLVQLDDRASSMVFQLHQASCKGNLDDRITARPSRFAARSQSLRQSVVGTQASRKIVQLPKMRALNTFTSPRLAVPYTLQLCCRARNGCRFESHCSSFVDCFKSRLLPLLQLRAHICVFCLFVSAPWADHMQLESLPSRPVSSSLSTKPDCHRRAMSRKRNLPWPGAAPETRKSNSKHLLAT